MSLYRQPDGTLYAVTEYQPSHDDERARWSEIRNTERYEAWRAKRNRVNREPNPSANSTRSALLSAWRAAPQNPKHGQ